MDETAIETPGPGPLAVIVTGLPATGKTSIARRIARVHSLPLLTKDEVKEILFERLGWGEREWSRRLGRASSAILLQFLRAHVAAGLPCIIESNFPPEAAPELLALLREQPFRPFQVVCRTRGDELYRRFRARTGRRHPGHGDEQLLEELKPQLLAARYEPLAIGGVLWELDTTDWQNLDLPSLHGAIKAAMGQPWPAGHPKVPGSSIGSES